MFTTPSEPHRMKLCRPLFISSRWLHEDLVTPARHVTQQSVPEEGPALHSLVVEAVDLFSVVFRG